MSKKSDKPKAAAEGEDAPASGKMKTKDYEQELRTLHV
jgi:hypothetical protein